MTSPILVTVYASDLGRLSDFYRGVFGLKTLESADGHVLLCGDGFEMAIVRVPGAVADEIGPVSADRPREETPIKVTFPVAEFESMRRLIRDGSGELKSADRAWAWRGSMHLDGVDPEGNVFQLRTAAKP